MTLYDRDRLIVQYVARFGQLTSTQIFHLVFPDSTRTPCDRALKRLHERRYLARIERRLVGGQRGGSGLFVYQLGRDGHALHSSSRYIPQRAVNFHSLAIADTFIYLKQLERDGVIRIIGYSTEPDCHATIGRYELKPDLYVELERPGGGVLKLWIEQDMATQGQRVIKDKFERYWHAYNQADAGEWPVFPLIVFVAVDKDRARELLWLLGQGKKEAQELFKVTTLAGLAAELWLQV